MGAPTLSRLQRALRDIVRAGSAEGLEQSAREAGIRGRALVYRTAYGIRMREALEEDFPAVRGALGDEAFGELARAFVARHPSRYASLAEFGQDFAAFIAETAGQGRPAWIAELAGLEWEQVLSSNEPDERPLELEALSALPGETQGRVILRLARSVRLVRGSWPLVALLSAALEGDSEGMCRARPSESCVVVHRSGEDTAATEVPRAEWAVLELIRRGTPLGGLVAALSELPPARVQACFAGWAARGWVTGFVLADEKEGA